MGQFYVDVAKEFQEGSECLAKLKDEYGADAVNLELVKVLDDSFLHCDLKDEPAIMHALLDDVFGKKYREKNKD